MKKTKCAICHKPVSFGKLLVVAITNKKTKEEKRLNICGSATCFSNAQRILRNALGLEVKF